ncbi:MAG: response regulator, partial [Kofleriaceae bacterium]
MRVLIIDDERLARSELRRLLGAHPELEIVGEARNADEALDQIARFAPDLVFLDVRMPGCDGFELLERLDDAPAVIFTTAFDQYALRAFEVSALDYLVKPIRPDRLAAALAKAAARIPASAGHQPLGR